MFKTIFSFENKTNYLIEIARTDMDSEDKSKIYFWLLIEKDGFSVTRLVFRSMSQSEDGENHREFEQGKLNFNNERAVFNGETLDAKHGDLASDLVTAIQGFLSSQ